MNQNQCVPSWGLEEDLAPVPRDVPPPPASTFRSHPDISLQDYEVTELTWENGQLTMHGLGLPRGLNNSNLASGTLESVVNQATQNPSSGGGACKKHDELVPLFDGCRYSDAPSVSISMDALVPTANNTVACSTRVGSCSVTVARVPTESDWSVSLTESERTLQHLSDRVNGLTSLDTTKMTTVTGGDDSVCHSRPQKGRSREVEDENKKKGSKRSRTAAIHNQSERKRRNKINERMKTLQKMVPNSSKTDKSLMLDEVIEYLKQLQAQVHMMAMPSMMMTMPMAMQMSLMSQMGMGMGMIGIDHMSGATVARPNNVVGISDPVGFPAHFVPNVAWDGVSCAPSIGHRISSYNPTMAQSDPLATYLACQQNQPMTMDAYSRMAAIYQQLHQQLGHTSNT